MKTKNVIVPRKVVLRHETHPEPYGESIVVFENGMFTDVYTDEKGRLITNTNNKKLIAYLRNISHEDETIVIRTDSIRLRSISILDFELIYLWFATSPIYRYDLIKDCDEAVRTFISHSITINSHVFILSKIIDFGLIGFTVVDNVAVVTIDIFDREDINENETTEMISTVINYIVSNYGLLKINVLSPENESLLNSTFSELGFKKLDGNPIVRKTLSGTVIEHIYELVI